MHPEKDRQSNLEHDLRRLNAYHLALFFSYSLGIWRVNPQVFESQLLHFLYHLDTFIKQYPSCEDVDFLDLKTKRQELHDFHLQEGLGQLILGSNPLDTLEIEALILLGN